MSLYMVCPSCNRLLADKEVIVEQMREENIPDSEIIKALHVPKECYCCISRLLTFVNLPKIIK